jgi:hypothetical protein
MYVPVFKTIRRYYFVSISKNTYIPTIITRGTHVSRQIMDNSFQWAIISNQSKFWAGSNGFV